MVARMSGYLKHLRDQAAHQFLAPFDESVAEAGARLLAFALLPLAPLMAIVPLLRERKRRIERAKHASQRLHTDLRLHVHRNPLPTYTPPKTEAPR